MTVLINSVGAEQVLLNIHALWPDAPFYTAVYSKKGAPWAQSLRINPSFLQKIPFGSRNHEFLSLITPMAFESFDFDGYDCVLTVTSADAKAVITKPSTVHICYCLTPTRYLWSGSETYRKYPGLGIGNSLARRVLSWATPTLRRWDTLSASRPDYYVAISKLVKSRIEEYYHRPVAQVIYPPVDTDFFTNEKKDGPPQMEPGYLLVVSRLVGYKRIDLIIQAACTLKRSLVIIGDGRERENLQRHVPRGARVYFITQKLTAEAIRQYYQWCEAFVFAAEEDFGIAAGEAQACGKPVIAYQKSGIAEIVENGKTGLLFPQQTAEYLTQAISGFNPSRYSASHCRSRALQFSKHVFESKMKSFVEWASEDYERNL